MGVCFADNCKVKRQSRSGYNLPPLECILSENLAPVSDTPEKHPATGTSDGKKTEKTAYTRHSDRMLSGKLFFFLRMADAIQKADGELRSFKKSRKSVLKQI